MRRYRGTIAIVWDHRVLVVRARGRTKYYLPGGIVEPNESPLRAAVRELKEETGIECAEDRLRFLATVVAPADASGPGVTIVSHTFWCTGGAALPQVRAQNEIVEFRWLAPSELGCVSILSRQAAQLAFCVVGGRDAS